MYRTLIMLGWILLSPTIAVAQGARVAVPEENFRAEPSGSVLASVLRGTTLRIGDRRDRWREATLEGWIWSASVGATQREGFDLVVTAAGGENLRARPNGELIARLRRGMALSELERDGRWVRVRRVAWIWEPSLTLDAAPPQPKTPAAERSDSAAARTAPRQATMPDSVAAATTPDSGAATTPATGWSRTGRAGAHLLGAPDGDTLASIRPMSAVEVVAREGSWARVRVEGWVWVPALATAADSSAVLDDVDPALLATNPEGFRGRVVDWTIQFIALERAEKIRTDFYEGEPFILARGPGEDAGFVYIAVPPERLDRVRSLTPLQRIRILARVRTGRSGLMGGPVLDLLEIR